MFASLKSAIAHSGSAIASFQAAIASLDKVIRDFRSVIKSRLYLDRPFQITETPF
jgi:hypothetical protein